MGLCWVLTVYNYFSLINPCLNYSTNKHGKIYSKIYSTRCAYHEHCLLGSTRPLHEYNPDMYIIFEKDCPSWERKYFLWDLYGSPIDLKSSFNTIVWTRCQYIVFEKDLTLWGKKRVIIFRIFMDHQPTRTIRHNGMNMIPRKSMEIALYQRKIDPIFLIGDRIEQRKIFNKKQTNPLFVFCQATRGVTPDIQ